MSKITGIGQLLLKLSLMVGWYPFLRHRVFGYFNSTEILSKFQLFAEYSNTVVKHLSKHCIRTSQAVNIRNNETNTFTSKILTTFMGSTYNFDSIGKNKQLILQHVYTFT